MSEEKAETIHTYCIDKDGCVDLGGDDDFQIETHYNRGKCLTTIELPSGELVIQLVMDGGWCDTATRMPFERLKEYIAHIEAELATDRSCKRCKKSYKSAVFKDICPPCLDEMDAEAAANAASGKAEGCPVCGSSQGETPIGGFDPRNTYYQCGTYQTPNGMMVKACTPSKAEGEG